MNSSHFSSSVLSWGGCFKGSGNSKFSRAHSSSKMSLRQNSFRGTSKLSGKRLESGCSDCIGNPFSVHGKAMSLQKKIATSGDNHGTD